MRKVSWEKAGNVIDGRQYLLNYSGVKKTELTILNHVKPQITSSIKSFNLQPIEMKYLFIYLHLNSQSSVQTEGTLL